MDPIDVIEQESKVVPHTGLSIQWGLIGGLANIILMIILFLANLQFQSWVQAISFLIMFACAFICTKAVREAHPYQLLSFGKGFSAAFLCAVVMGIIGLAFFWVYVHYIDTGYYEQLIVMTKGKMMDKGLSEEQVTAALKMQSKFMTPTFTMIFGAVGNIFLGAIIALVCAGILKKSPKY